MPSEVATRTRMTLIAGCPEVLVDEMMRTRNDVARRFKTTPSVWSMSDDVPKPDTPLEDKFVEASRKAKSNAIHDRLSPSSTSASD